LIIEASVSYPPRLKAPLTDRLCSGLNIPKLCGVAPEVDLIDEERGLWLAKRSRFSDRA
jgi:hypothetical protein